MQITSLDPLAAHPNSILVVIGADMGFPYLACPTRLIGCDEPTLRQLLGDLSAIAKWEDESHRLELAEPGTTFGELEHAITAKSDSLILSSEFTAVVGYVRQILTGEASDLVTAIGGEDPELLWGLAGDQWDESLYLRLVNAYGELHRRFTSDQELIGRAIERRWMRVLHWLQSVGADFDAPNADGEFPLHVAAFHGNVQAARFLLGVGVNPVPRSRDGKSPLDRALYCGEESRKQLRELLWPFEWPAAAARQRKLNDLTRP